MAGKKQVLRVKVQVTGGTENPTNAVENYNNTSVFLVEGSDALSVRDRKEIETSIKQMLEKQGHTVVRPNAKLAEPVKAEAKA